MPWRPDLVRYGALGCAVNVQSSRGCPGQCAFCATPGLPEDLRRWQPRDVALVVDEMEHEAQRLEAAGLPPIFNFVDDDFGPLVRVERLADELEARELRVAFALEMRLASLIGQPWLAERLARLREAGLTRVFVGVESLNPDTLRRWHKPYDVAALPEVLGALRSAGVAVQAGYILWHKGQTLEGARWEVDALRELGIYSHRAAMSRLIVFRGCALAREGVPAQGFEPLEAEAEDFLRRFSAKTADLADTWARAAIAEPYEAAKAYLGGDGTELLLIRQQFEEANAASYRMFCEMLP